MKRLSLEDIQANKLEAIEISKTYLNTAEGLEDEYFRILRLQDVIDDIEKDPEALSQSYPLQSVLLKAKSYVNDFRVINYSDYAKLKEEFAVLRIQLEEEAESMHQLNLEISRRNHLLNQKLSKIKFIVHKLYSLPAPIRRILVSDVDLNMITSEL